jgi:hypothetical protein
MRRWIPPQWLYAARVLRGRERHASRNRFLRDAIGWLVPIPLQNAILAAAYAWKGVRVDNADLKNRHRGRRAFVIGNGPSLGKQDLQPLADEITIGANSFYKHPHSDAVNLKYLCIGDPGFMTDEPRSVDWHRMIEKRMPRTELILHPHARQLIEKYGLYTHQRVRYFRRGVNHPVPELIDFDLNRPVNVGVTTGTTLCIPLAIYLGCTEIYLLGFDANWLDNYTASYHFYQTHEQFPEYDTLGKDQRWEMYEDQLLVILREFETHRLIATRGRQIGVKIWNATEGGRLDMYPRIRYEDVIAGHPRSVAT